ncbi:MAG: hypothetical protein K1W25_16320 [Lachnospiraceae bacterium]
MKIYKKFAAALTVLCMMSGVSEELTVKADDISEEIMTETITETEITIEPAAEIKMTTEQDHSEEQRTDKAEELSEAEPETFDETPMFEACLEYSPQGWFVKGVFRDFASDTCLVQPMYSLDGETYRDCGQEWDLRFLGSENEDELEKLQNQRCLYDSEDPLKSYLAKELNRFYIKLRIVREGGITCETQAAVIDRGELQPMPKEFSLAARFASGMSVREGRPPNIQYYGRYQITVNEDAAGEEISAFLPDTLPVEIQLQKGPDYIGNDIVDCPVTWKPLHLTQLTAGESVTVLDAAEELEIPASTILNTQTGIYQLNEPMGINQWITDEVRLVLNVVAKDGQPAGVLAAENHGLEMAFNLKPTGAVSIRAYTFMKDGAEWMELPGLSLTDAVNAQPSTANSGYATILEKEQEPYQSYWKAQEAGEEPTPFFIGLKIEGGVYDGRQLVLAWPDTYELPPDLPEIGGSGGNEGNVGSDDKEDSTEGGQRPGLPEDPEDGTTPEPPEDPEDGTTPEPPEDPEDGTTPEPPEDPEDGTTPEPPEDPEDETTPELPEAPINEKISVSKAEIPENEMLENEMSGTGTEIPGHQETAAPVQQEATVQATAESGVKMEEEMRDVVHDATAAGETATTFSGYEEERVQSDIKEKADRGAESGSHGMIWPAAAGVTAILTGVCIAAARSTAVKKIMDTLRRLFMRK